MKNLRLEILEEFAHQAQAYVLPPSIIEEIASKSKRRHYEKCRRAIQDLITRIHRMKRAPKKKPVVYLHPKRKRYVCEKCNSNSPTHRCHA